MLAKVGTTAVTVIQAKNSNESSSEDFFEATSGWLFFRFGLTPTKIAAGRVGVGVCADFWAFDSMRRRPLPQLCHPGLQMRFKRSMRWSTWLAEMSFRQRVWPNRQLRSKQGAQSSAGW